MLTLFDCQTQTTAPMIAAEAPCDGIRQQPAEMYEALLAQAEAKSLKHVPGGPLINAAEPCRTWICNCTRAVPHGSFL